MTEPYWASGDGDVTLFLGDCLDVLRTLEADSIDAIVTDPPAGIAFMGRDWDDFRRARWRFTGWLAERMAEALRVLKPGGHLLVWSLPRTSHWTAWALEDAGLEIRDCIVHLFGSGFPKSLDVSKAIDRTAGAVREVVGASPDSYDRSASSWQAEDGPPHGMVGRAEGPRLITAPATEDAARWAGFGTALKPGQEMWWLARKPLAAGTVAGNVLEWGTGALNIDGCKVGTEQRVNNAGGSSSLQRVSRVEAGYRPTVTTSRNEDSEVTGRWPANVVFTHSAACEPAGTRRVRGSSRADRGRDTNGIPSTSLEGGVDGSLNQVQSPGYADAEGLETVEAWVCAADCPVGELDRQSGNVKGAVSNGKRAGTGYDGGFGPQQQMPGYGDTGGASRFYPVFRYQAKAPTSERPRLADGTAHETVKPLGLISWLCRLITPPGGTVLDLFAGSGPVAEACIVEGFRCVLVEQDPKSAELIVKRLGKPIQPVMFGLDA